MCVWERRCVTKMCVKDCLWQRCVCDRLCVTKSVCVTKMCVNDGVRQRCVPRIVRDKDVCERWCVTKMCVCASVTKRRRTEEEEAGGTDLKTRSPHNDGEKNHGVTRLFYLFACLDLLSTDSFLFWLFLFSDFATLAASVHKWEVWLLNFLRLTANWLSTT